MELGSFLLRNNSSNLVFCSDLAQDGFQRLASRVSTLISRKRSPGVCDTPPQDCAQMQGRSIRTQIFHEPSWLLPGRERVCQCFTPVACRMIDHHHRLCLARVTKRLKTCQNNSRVSRVGKHLRRHIVCPRHTPSPLEPPVAHGRPLANAMRRVPGRRHRGSKCPS